MPTDRERAAATMRAWVYVWLHPNPEMRELSRACVTSHLTWIRAIVRYKMARAKLELYKWRKGL